MLNTGDHIFISYAPKDSDFALWLYEQLAAAGQSAWIDVKQVRPGTAWDDAVRGALDQATHVIALMSRSSLLTPYTKADWDYAQSQGIEVIPLVIDDSKVPLKWASAEPIYFSPKRADEALQALRLRLPQTTIEGEAELKLEPISLVSSATVARKADHDPLAMVRQLALERTQNNSLLAYLEDESPLIRQEAIIGLARIQSESSRLPLQLVALQDDSPLVRLYATAALMTYDKPDALSTWLNQLATTTIQTELKTAINALQLRLPEIIRDPVKHAFISYSRRDADSFANDLADHLRSEGFSVWIDSNLEAGTPVWMHEIEKAIRQAGVCIIVLSPLVHESEWVPKEVQFARQFKKPLLPIKYLDTHKPLYLSTEQGLRDDLPFADHPEKMLRLLVDTLDKFIARTR